MPLIQTAKLSPFKPQRIRTLNAADRLSSENGCNGFCCLRYSYILQILLYICFVFCVNIGPSAICNRRRNPIPSDKVSEAGLYIPASSSLAATEDGGNRTFFGVSDGRLLAGDVTGGVAGADRIGDTTGGAGGIAGCDRIGEGILTGGTVDIGDGALGDGGECIGDVGDSAVGFSTRELKLVGIYSFNINRSSGWRKKEI